MTGDVRDSGGESHRTAAAPGWPNLAVQVHMRDGTIRAIPYDCNEESPSQAIERVYRHGDAVGPDFMVYDVSHVSFPSESLSSEPDHVTVYGQPLRDLTPRDLGIGASDEDSYRSGPSSEESVGRRIPLAFWSLATAGDELLEAAQSVSDGVTHATGEPTTTQTIDRLDRFEAARKCWQSVRGES